MDRITVYIDGSNFYHLLKTGFGKTNVDFERFIIKIADILQGRLVHVHYYNSPRRREDGENEYRAQQKFLNYLRTIPDFTIHLGRLEPREKECPECKAKYRIMVEKGVDVNIGVDMVKGAFDNFFDIAVLVSGDGDFSPLISTVKHMGKKAFYASTTPTFALNRVADDFLQINEVFLSDCWRE